MTTDTEISLNPDSPDERTSPAASRPRLGAWWLCVFAAAASLYLATANRDVQWQDSGWQQLRIVTGQIDHPRGLALVHPVQFWLGRAAVEWLPVEPAFAVTIISALAGAVGIANLFVTLLVLTNRRVCAAIPAAALGLAHTYWMHATHTESYAITVALLTGEWLCLALWIRDRRAGRLLLLALLNGVGVANHLLAGLATLVDVGMLALAVRRRWISLPLLLGCSAAWVLGTLPYSLLVIQKWSATGDLAGTLRSALFGIYSSRVMNINVSLSMLALTLGFIAYNFPGLTVPLAMYGAWRVPRDNRLVRNVVGIQLLVYLVFVARYSITDQFTFFLPVYATLALLSGLGLARVAEIARPRLRRSLVAVAAATALAAPALYPLAAHVARSRQWFEGLVRNKPYRDGYRSFFVPWGAGDDHATRLIKDARALAGADGVILFVEDTVGYSLRYAKATGRLPAGVTVARIEEADTSPNRGRWERIFSAYVDRGTTVILVPRDRTNPATCVPHARWYPTGHLFIFAGFL